MGLTVAVFVAWALLGFVGIGVTVIKSPKLSVVAWMMSWVLTGANLVGELSRP
jgi:hypothetical protein